MLRNKTILGFAVFLVASLSLAQGEPARKSSSSGAGSGTLIFTYQNIIVPGAKITEPLGISNTNVIVGTSTLGGFLLTNGIIQGFNPFYETAVAGMNSSGDTVGYYDPNFGRDPPEGFLLKNGKFTVLDVPGVTGTIPHAISDSGSIVGEYYDNSSPDSSYQGFLFNGGTFTTLDFPGAQITEARGVNDQGQIAGIYEDSLGTQYSFIYSSGSFQQLVVPGCTDSGALGINNKGDVVGFCETSRAGFGYLYKDGAFTFLSAPEGIGRTLATAVNDIDDVVGYYAPPGASDIYYGFLATPAN
jgi:uncharacterized membrane protein